MDEPFNSVECNNESGKNEKELYCDLPRPRVKKYTDFNISAHQHTPERSAEGHLVSTANRSLRYIDSVHELLPDLHSPDKNMTKAQLLEALRHSQTRARQAEKVANQAYADKEHVVKLVLIQASHLFAYKQWFQLVQLENVYLQFVSNKGRSVSIVFPVKTTQEMHKREQRVLVGKKGEKQLKKCIKESKRAHVGNKGENIALSMILANITLFLH